MNTQKVAEYKKSISDQAEAIKEYVSTFELYMAKDEVALGEICGMMDDIARKVGDINKSLNEQAEALKRYVSQFEEYMSADEQSFGEVSGMMGRLTLRVEEIEKAHKKRMLLLGELNRTYKELEDSHTKFAEKIRSKVGEES